MTHAIIRFDSAETARWCRRFGVDPARCTNIEVSIPAPGLVGHVRFDLHLQPGDLDALGGTVDEEAAA